MASDDPAARSGSRWATYPAVLFDVDGTLLDVSERYVEGYRRAVARYGLTAPEPQVIRECKARGCSGRQILAALYPTIDERLVARIDHTRAGETGAPDLQRLDRPVPGALATISRLREARVAIAFVTLRPSDANRVLSNLHFAVPGDVIVNVTTRDKSQSLRRVADLLQAGPAECVVVGDAPDDIVAARRAGMVPVAVSYGLVGAERLRAETPSAVIDDLPSLLPFLGLESQAR